MESLLAHFEHSLTHSPPAALALAYLAGLLASLTPCVYPMLPITAGVIGHANVGGTRLRAFALSAVYVLGMALTYAGLGFFAAATGRLFGTVASNPWTLLLVGNIILFFALWMLEAIQLPSFNFAGFKNRGGLFGLFAAGVSAALVAGPCTTPLLGLLITYTASAGNMAFGALLFFVFSLGLGTLLLAVGTFAGALAALPRSGPWMVGIKKALGIAMVLTAEFFILKAGSGFLF